MPRQSLAQTSPNALKRRPLSAAGPSLSTETATVCITRRHPLTVRDRPTDTLHAPKTQWVAPPGHPGIWLVNTYPANRKAQGHPRSRPRPRRDAPPRPPSTQRCRQLHPDTREHGDSHVLPSAEPQTANSPRDTVVLSKHGGATRAVYQQGHRGHPWVLGAQHQLSPSHPKNTTAGRAHTPGPAGPPSCPFLGRPLTLLLEIGMEEGSGLSSHIPAGTSGLAPLASIPALPSRSGRGPTPLP